MARSPLFYSCKDCGLAGVSEKTGTYKGGDTMEAEIREIREHFSQFPPLLARGEVFCVDLTG